MNERKVCFIRCVNDELYDAECSRYISKLLIPEGFEVEEIAVNGAASMASGYNKAMQSSDAKFKIYLHQDVFIINKNFIFDILKVFGDGTVGMIGLVGSPQLPEDGIMWSGPRIGNICVSNVRESGAAFIGKVDYPWQEVDAVDGLLIATQYDILWREDIFKGWDFYDISQGMEFCKRGYKVVVPHVDSPWVLHDSRITDLTSYYKWKEVFKREYGMS